MALKACVQVQGSRQSAFMAGGSLKPAAGAWAPPAGARGTLGSGAWEKVPASQARHYSGQGRCLVRSKPPAGRTQRLPRPCHPPTAAAAAGRHLRVAPRASGRPVVEANLFSRVTRIFKSYANAAGAPRGRKLHTTACSTATAAAAQPLPAPTSPRCWLPWLSFFLQCRRRRTPRRSWTRRWPTCRTT